MKKKRNGKEKWKERGMGKKKQRYGYRRNGRRKSRKGIMMDITIPFALKYGVVDETRIGPD